MRVTPRFATCGCARLHVELVELDSKRLVAFTLSRVVASAENPPAAEELRHARALSTDTHVCDQAIANDIDAMRPERLLGLTG